jgi:FMN phosphatase YigB (HAD superfamily)
MTNKPILALSGRVVRCILFDLGGTIWHRNKRDWPQLEVAANQRAGALFRRHVAPTFLLEMDDTELGNHLRKALHEQFRELIRRDARVEPDGAHALLQVLLQWGLEKSDLALSTALFEALRISAAESRILFKDTLPTLAALQARGFQLGVVTNRLWGGQPFVNDMEALGLLTYFDPGKMAISADLRVRKPTPAIYLHALRAHNIAPEHAVMVGDSLPADVVGPQQLGMLAVWSPKRLVVEMVKAHFATFGASLQTYNTHHVSPPAPHPGAGSPDPLPSDMFDTSLADILGHADYWQQFLRGQIKPDLIIEHMRDLLDVFVEAGVQ